MPNTSGYYTRQFNYNHISQMFLVGREISGNVWNAWNNVCTGTGNQFTDSSALAQRTSKGTSGRTTYGRNDRVFLTFDGDSAASVTNVGVGNHTLVRDFLYTIRRVSSSIINDNDAHYYRAYAGDGSLSGSPGTNMYNDFDTSAYSPYLNLVLPSAPVNRPYGFKFALAHNSTPNGNFNNYIQQQIINKKPIQVVLRNKADYAVREPSDENRTDWGADDYATSSYRPSFKFSYQLPTASVTGSTF